MEYLCERCGDTFTCKRNLISHLHRLKVCQASSSDAPSREDLLKKVTTKQLNDVNFPCKYCEQKFNTKSAMYKHSQKCTKHPKRQAPSNDVSVASSSSSSVQNVVNVVSNVDLEALKNELKKEILIELQQKAQMVINNTTTNNITIQSTQNIVNNFGNEDTSHLTEDFLSYCLMNPKKGMTKLIENIHYNPDIPANFNLRCKSLKQNIFEKYVDSEWRICDASNTLDELIRRGYSIMNLYYIDNVLNDPDVQEDENKIRMFERFRFLGDKSCNDYRAVKRDLRLLVKDRTMYLLASPTVQV